MEEMICKCGLQMSKNPHPFAGDPRKICEVGAVYECIPCRVKRGRERLNRILELEEKLSWIPVKNESDLPTDGKAYWLTYRDFYGKRHLGKGAKTYYGWEVKPGVYFPAKYILAYMPVYDPEPFQG